MEEPVKKYFRLFPGNEVRVKGAYFIKCEEVVKNDDGSIKELHCTYDPETRSGSGFEGRKVKGTIHFVDARTAVKIKIRNYNYLMIDDENGEQILNPDSVEETWGYAEPAIMEAKPGERFQFFRHENFSVEAWQALQDKESMGHCVFTGDHGAWLLHLSYLTLSLTKVLSMHHFRSWL